MIISASYKTDIPAFYGAWFMNRLRAGSCKMVNPYGHQIYEISLLPENVDGFVFWTKNIGPFLKHLPEIQQRGYPFIVQHTTNGYPRELESRVTDYTHTVEHMRRLAGDYGADRLVWRYDPIIFSSLTSFDWHLKNFASLAAQLEGTTGEVVISFAQIYKKTKRNMELAAKEHDFTWDEHKSDAFVLEQGCLLTAELTQIAKLHRMQLKICSQKAFLIPGVEEARCVDAERLEHVGGHAIEARRKGNRKECGCFASRDIGEYDTCPHGCVYCYAVRNRELALDRYKEHNPHSPFLFEPKDYKLEQEQSPDLISISNGKKSRQESKQRSDNTQPEQGQLFPI